MALDFPAKHFASFSQQPDHLSHWLSLMLYFEAGGPGPGAVRGQPINMNSPSSSQTPENLQQMKKLMEQELKSDKFKSNSNKGYVFTLMPLYAIGVGVFAAYKFLKVNKENTTKLHLSEFSKMIHKCRICNLFFLLPDQVHRWPGTKRKFCKRGQKVSGGRCVCYFAYPCFLCSNIYIITKTNFLLFVCVFVCGFGCVSVCVQKTSWTSWNKGWRRRRGCSIPSSPSWTRSLTGELHAMSVCMRFVIQVCALRLVVVPRVDSG